MLRTLHVNGKITLGERPDPASKWLDVDAGESSIVSHTTVSLLNAELGQHTRIGKLWFYYVWLAAPVPKTSRFEACTIDCAGYNQMNSIK